MRTWTEDEIKIIRKHAAKGNSFTDAGKEIGVSRSAIAGKARREGIRFACTREKAQRGPLSRAASGAAAHV